MCKDFQSTKFVGLSDKANLVLHFKDRKATLVARTLSNHNLPTDRAKELFKPFKKTGSLLCSI